MSQLPNEVLLMLMQAMRAQHPPKVKQVRRIPVHFNFNSGVMYPCREGIGLTDGEMPLQISDWVDDGERKVQLEQAIVQWEMLMESPEWHLVGTESEMCSADKNGMSSEGDQMPLAEAHEHSVKYFYDRFAVFHKY
jgi:hypothetical protein